MPVLMPSPSAAVVAVRDLLASTVADQSLPDDARARTVRRLRDDLADLIGQADLYLGDTDLRREAQAANRQARLAEARENADVREEAIRRGLASAEDLDAMGYYSHARLDAMAEDGTLYESLEEAFGGVRVDPAKLAAAAAKRRRSSGGQFADEFGAPASPKGRGGAKLKTPKGTPNTPGGTSAEARARATAAARAASAGGDPKPNPTPKPGAPGKPAAPKRKRVPAPKPKPAVGAKKDGDWIDVGGDVNKAADLLAQGKKVRLDQKREASTLIRELAKRVQEAKAKGDKAPNFDLCKVTVKNTNLFCAESKGIPRIKMPQLSGVPKVGSKGDSLPKDKNGGIDLTEQFREHLTSTGSTITDTSVPASNLKASQIELNGAKVASMVGRLEEGGTLGDSPIFTSSDDYIVDGHHRWAAQVGHDLADDKLGDITMPVSQVDMGIIELLDAANTFAAEWGIPQADVSQGRTGALKEDGPAYFHTDAAALSSKYGGEVKVENVPLDKIQPTRARPEGIANAKPHMEKAAAGEGAKRDPITLIRQPDGGFKVHDGNSTFAIAKEAGWSSIPAIVVDDEAEAKRIEGVAGEHKERAKRRKAIDAKVRGMWKPGDEAEATQDFADLDTLYEAAMKDAPAFKSLLTEELPGTLGASTPSFDEALTNARENPAQPQVLMGPPKKREAAERKMVRKFDGDHNRLDDLIRATILVERADQMPAALEAVRARAEAQGWTLKGGKDRYSDPPPPPATVKGPTAAGYSDTVVKLVSPNGVVAELQFNTQAMFLVKEADGHKLFEEQREIQAKIAERAQAAPAAGKRRVPAGATRAELKRIRELDEAMAGLYTAAREAAYGD